MPDDLSNLSTEQLKMLLQAMENKIGTLVQNDKQNDQISSLVINPQSNVPEVSAHSQTHNVVNQMQLQIEQMSQQLNLVLQQIQNHQTAPTNKIEDPLPKVTEITENQTQQSSTQETSQIDPFEYMAASYLNNTQSFIEPSVIPTAENYVVEEVILNKPAYEAINNQTIQNNPLNSQLQDVHVQDSHIQNVHQPKSNPLNIQKIDELLERMGFSEEIRELARRGDSNALQNKIHQLAGIFLMMPDFQQADENEIKSYIVSVTEELKIVTEIEKPQYQSSSLDVPKQVVPRIDLKPNENKQQPKVIELKDIFKKFRKDSQEETVGLNTQSESNKTQMQERAQYEFSRLPQQNLQTQPEPLHTEEKPLLDKILSREKKPYDEYDTNLKKFELLKELLLTHIDGATQRELVRTSKDIEQNKKFLLALYDRALGNDSITVDIEILSSILERINKKLGIVKASKGTISAWVELDEDINNIQNFYLLEAKKKANTS